MSEIKDEHCCFMTDLAKIIPDPDNEHRITFTFIDSLLYKIDNEGGISCFYFCYISADFGPRGVTIFFFL
jgi:hypothetical protein